MTEVEYVKLRGYAFFNMLRSAVEVREESLMHLFGRKDGNNLYVANASGIQTAERTKSVAEDSNRAAIERLRALDEAVAVPVKRMGGIVYRKIGEAHSHPSPRTCSSLSKDDRDNVFDEMRLCDLPYWLEIIISTEFKEYKHRREPHARLHNYPRKLRILIENGQMGFDMTFAAYYFCENGSRISVAELPILIPEKYFRYFR